MIIPVLLLLSLGIVVIYTSNPLLAIQQLFFAIFGLILYVIIRNLDYKSLKNAAKSFYIGIVILLIITMILGFESRGSIRWIPLGLFNLQPSEFAKPILILLLATFWTKNLPNWKNIFKSILLIIPAIFLVFRQPDLGTTLTLVFIWLSIFIASNASFKKIVIITLTLLLLLPLIWSGLQPYQKQRIISFLSPNQDPQGIGFHVIQSTIAVGSGELLGRGLGRGTQSRLQFLPEFRTDFIFAFIAEELGFLGSAIVLGLYTIIFVLIFNILSRIGDRLGELIVFGVLGMLFFQISVNIGMNIGLLPITGITLPFLSYGGSSLVATLISIGLIESVSKYGLKKREIKSFNLA